MERVFLLETADPTQNIYNRADSMKAMRWMKQVVDSRLAAPRKSRFGEPADAATETDIIAVGKQFAGFGDYPELSAAFNASYTAFCILQTLPTIRAVPNTRASSKTRLRQRQRRRCPPKLD